MIPYLIINGVSSKTINGLMVQSLAPITKPPLRTEVEEIDGRDGEIVTELGYGAYTKPITIGLTRGYNVDDVIKFFCTSGDIIFSNELDKVYRFAVYEQIDFERLLRFKTAQIKIRVQPFKYNANEGIIRWLDGGTIANINILNEGNIYSKPMITFRANGNVNIYINNEHILEVSLTEETTVHIDPVSQNATDDNGNYLNRLVTGDYDNIRLNAGENLVRITGQLEEITIKEYSRWI